MEFGFPEDTLDLHGNGPQQPFVVEDQLLSFLETAYATNKKYLLIITGKGIHSPQGPRVKPLVKQLLAKSKLIEEFAIAPIEFGGEGAFVVILKNYGN